MNTSYVYLFHLKDKSAIKIGKSDNPHNRFSQLTNYYDLDVNQSHIYRCSNSTEAFLIERTLHNCFSPNRTVLEFDGGTEFFDYKIKDDIYNMLYILSNQYNIVQLELQQNDIIINNCDICKVDVLSNRLGKAIKRKRLLLNISQKQLSKVTNITRQTLTKIEKGKSKASIHSVISVLVALDMDDIFNDMYNTDDYIKQRASKHQK